VPAALPFDTLDYARKLEAAGVPSAQAELQARALNDAIATSVASRDDLTRLEGRLDGKIESHESRLDGKFESLESRFDGKFENLEGRLDGKLESLESRLNAKFANVDARFENVDTRLASLESRFNAKVDNLESSLNAKIANLKNELQLELRRKIETLKWMFGTLVVLNGAMLVQLLLRH
jgi:Skp family chaperone for outer membrane proteins